MKEKEKAIQKILSPNHNSRLAYTLPGSAKRTALLFDQICTRHFSNIPPELLFLIPNALHYQKGIWKKILNKLKKKIDPKGLYTGMDVVHAIEELEVRTAVESFSRYGYIVTPVYDRQEKFLTDYPKGPILTYQAALKNLPTVIEEQTSWDQILEFRKDKNALGKYRKLRYWLDNSLKAKSISQAEDIICKRIEDYEWALKKHDLKTATGALSSILDWKGMTVLASGAGIAGVLGGPIWSAIAGGLLLSSKVSVWIAERMIDREDIRKGEGSEIALIYDAKRRLGKQKNK